LSTPLLDNRQLGPDVARANLLVNPGFEWWQRGNGPFTANFTYSADRWLSSLAGTDTLSVAKDTTNMDTGSMACAACTFTLGTGAGATGLFQQFINTDAGGQLSGRPLALSVRVRTSVANAVRLSAFGAYSAYHPGNGTYQTLSVTGTSVGSFSIAVVFVASCTAYLDNATLVVGSQPANYVPLHPSDDLSRCLRYYEQRSDTWLASGYNVNSTLGEFVLKSAARKGGTPTITATAAGGFAIRALGASNAASSFGSLIAGIDSSLIQVNVASGLTVGQGTIFQSAGGSIAMEWNP
jgi:hypothetical protein